MPGRKDIRALRRLAPKLRPPCEECAERAAGGCRYSHAADCPKLEYYLLATLPGAESITGDEARRISQRAIRRARLDPCGMGAAVEDALFDKIDAPPPDVPCTEDAFPEGGDDAFVQCVFEELLQGKLTFQAIADKLYGTAEEVRAIADAMIDETDDAIVQAIIRDRLTGAGAARRFGKARQHVWRSLDRFRHKPGVYKFLYGTPSRRGGAGSMKRLNITLNLEDNLIHDLDLIATRLGRSREDIFTGICARWFAERDLNRGTGERLYEFQPGLTALELYSETYRHLENERRRRDGRDLEAIAMQNATMIATAQTFEALRAAGSLPADLPETVDRELVMRLWVQLKRGEITQAAFDGEIDYQRRFPCGEVEEGD